MDKNNYILVFSILLVAGIVLAAAYLQWFVFDFMLVAIGVGGGLVISYLLFHSFNQQNHVILAEGEEVLIDSSGCGAHIMVRRIGEENPQSVLEADLYLTNIGIIAQDPRMHELILYIPLDTIAKADLEGKGIKINYFDEYHNEVAQIVLMVGKSHDEWVRNIVAYLRENRSERPPQ